MNPKPLIWHKITDKLPNDQDQCLLCGENDLMQGPILWNGEAKLWIDLFGPMTTPEAGISISPNSPGLTHWAIVNSPYDDD